MYIKPEAKLVIDKVLAERNFDSIRLDIINDNGQESIALEIGNSSAAEDFTEIDGVRVLASKETLQALANVVFTADEDGRIGIRELVGCGCNHEHGEGDCGCNHEHGEDGCGCNHEHGEDGCGCNHEHGEGGCGCNHEHSHEHSSCCKSENK